MDNMKLASNILENIGGKKNILKIEHCMTSLRIVLEDSNIVSDDKLKSIDGVITVIRTEKYYQIVVGTNADDLYRIITSDNPPKKKFYETVLEYFSATFVPSLAILCAGGIIKGLVAILVVLGLLPENGGLYILFNSIGDVAFYFLPVFVSYNLGVKIGLNKYIALACGLALVYPKLNLNPSLVIMGRDMSEVTYGSTVLPSVVAIIIARYLEKLFNKILPDLIKGFITPVLVLLISVGTVYLYLGPGANAISNSIYYVVESTINFSPTLAGLIVGFTWQILVLFGVHMAAIVPSLIALANGQKDVFIALTEPSVFSQAAVVFTMWLVTKNKKQKELQLPAWIAGIFGVTPPAIYGFTLQNMKLFIIGCIGGAIGGAYIGFSKVISTSMTGLGIFALIGKVDPQNSMNLVNAIIGNAIGIVVAIILTLLVYREKNE